MECPSCKFARADIERNTGYGYAQSLNASTDVGVRAIAELEEKVTDQNFAINHKVVLIINEAQALKKPSIAALLPVLEHQNPNVHWIFTTMEDGFMQGSSTNEAGFRRRAKFVRFSTLNEHQAREYTLTVMKKLGFPTDEEIIERITSQVPAITLSNIETLAAVDFNLEEFERSIANIMPGTVDTVSFNDSLVTRILDAVNQSSKGQVASARDLILSALRDIIERKEETNVDEIRQRVCYSCAKTMLYMLESRTDKLPNIAFFIKVMQGEGIHSSKYYSLVADLTTGFMKLTE